ncbi:DUF6191 domain-containing protein [Streptomyces sp. NPDC006173]|uniref:DUF6191 domain-containing protein n=1 Tax=Streptomyces sp. NPDC006173 TaxID=3155349 RepID=UPI0033EED43F
MFNMFEELFAPGRKHTDDERKRLELSRVDLNDGDPGRGPIDLTSGKVVVRAPRHDEDQEKNADQPNDADQPKAGVQDQSTAQDRSTSPDQSTSRDRDEAPNSGPSQAS